MTRSASTIRLTLAALGTLALFGAAAAAGVDRNAEIMASGIAPEHVQTNAVPPGAANDPESAALID